VAAAQESTIRTCESLTHGDDVEAWHDWRLLHRGRVSQTLPLCGDVLDRMRQNRGAQTCGFENVRDYSGLRALKPGAGETGSEGGLITSKLIAAAG
jgi:hypothetical protein